MFGKILNIDGNNIVIENLSKKIYSEYMGVYLIFQESDRKVVGEVLKMDTTTISMLLIGEIINNVFSAGVIKKPITIPRVINVSELELIIGKQSDNVDTLLMGMSPIYKNFNVYVSLNDFFANHSAIIGNSGSGKSCGVARILQNLFVNKKEKPLNSHFIIFDAYGEYKDAFITLNNVGLNYKKYNTKVSEEDEEQLKIPLYYLEADDLALLLSANDSDLIPVLEKTLKLVYIFTSTNPYVIDYKNDIIAKCLLDILTSGKNASQMRDQIIAVLSHYNTKDINLDSIIKQPGYDRTLKQCLLVDEQGKMSAILLVNEFLNKFTKLNLEDIIIDDEFVYTLNDLYSALEFALMSEGTINSDLNYSKKNILKTRLQTIINSDYKVMFEMEKYISKTDFVKRLFKNNLDENAQLVNINLSNVDDRFAKVITKIYSKMIFNYTTSLDVRGSYPVNIILEEAHRYVQNDNDINVIGYNIFDRITKEGRKYGCLLTFVTQRPSELSNTCLSQCSNYLVFRIFHPKDFEIIKSISTNVSDESLERIKALSSGTALIFGTAFKVPQIVKMGLPNPMPQSTSVKVNNIWYKQEKL